jgi:ribosomal protein S12 methylthiotransferase
MKKDRQDLRVGFVSLGCPKNQVDSEKMLGLLGQSGCVVTGDEEGVDVLVINTCGFIQPAKEEALEVIRKALVAKGRGRVGRVVVAGCLSQRMGAELGKEAEGIDAIVGLGDRDKIAAIVAKAAEARETGQPAVYLGRRTGSVAKDRGRLLIGSGHSAYLRISEGCNRRCSFCTIPSIRGRFHSKRKAEILAEAKELAANGVGELILIAQDSTSWGRDLGIKDGLPGLLEDLHAIDGPRWIRLMYLYPTGISDTLIETIAKLPKIIHYIDMPLQHISDSILRAMRRSDRREKTIALIERLRTAMPDVILRTTLIVGLPGEGESEFNELLEFVQWARFDAMGCFVYYPEEGTAAARMDGQVDSATKLRRQEQIMLAQQKIAFDLARKRIGLRLDCLVDEVRPDGSAVGRFYGQAPEIDGVCLIRNNSARPGEFVGVTVAESRDYDLIVDPVSS